MTSTVRLAALALLTTLLASGCASHHVHSDAISWRSGLVVASATAENGTPIEWRLYAGREGKPRIERTSRTKAITPRIGVRAVTMTRERAESVGVEPFVGVWLEEVVDGGASAKAGLAPGDIVVAVAGEEVRSAEQFHDLVKTRAVPGEELELTVRVYRRGGDTLDGDRRASVIVVPEAYETTDTEIDSVALEYSRGVQVFTGLQVAEVPSELAQVIVGVDEPIVMVSGIVTGSPAYYAGLRRGDRVTACDGVPVVSLDDVRRAVQARLDEGVHPLDLASVEDDGVEREGGRVEISVTGELGDHTGRMEVVDTLSDRTDFHIPILVDYHSDLDHTSTSFLDFIFQFGFNYWSNTKPSTTRAPESDWELSIFPFGMFEFEKRGERREITLFWLIDIGL